MESNREMIGYEIGVCSLGKLLVATSEQGVCAILMGDDAGDLARDLQRRFPQAELILGAVPAGHFARVASHIAAPRSGLDLPLDLQGSEFRKRVWRALRAIPPGALQTYGEIARRVGAPRAAKEVGEACAANALAVAVPCHRVVRSDGTLAGYRWGAKRKLALLMLEGARLGATPDLFDETSSSVVH
jgi:AraC family transcriptional regulator of adaptative response/methylated-DNA-[protein]-cysteine methyltransferase